MTSHGVARPTTAPSQSQLAAEATKIQTYNTLVSSLRAHISTNGYTYTPESFSLTTKILRLNPEFYTIWNVRRRLLTDGLLSKQPPSSSPSTASPTTSATRATKDSSEISSSSAGLGIPASPGSPRGGPRGSSGSIAEGNGGSAQQQTPTQHQEETEREAAAAQDLPVLQAEFTFTIPLLLASPKCYWIWNYRRWILPECIARLPNTTARQVWLEELALDSKMLRKDQRNFHAWGYRRYLVEMLESNELQGKSMVEAEFDFTTTKINTDLSNFSAWHARSRLIPRLLDERGTDAKGRREFLRSEMELIRGALDVGPEDQSLWFYHQFLMASIVGDTTSVDDTYAIVKDYTVEERIQMLVGEIDQIADLAKDYNNVKWTYEALLEYTVALGQLRELEDQERESLREWLGKLRVLDPLRQGRWDDVEANCKL